MIHAEPFVTAVDGGGHEAAFGGWGGKGGQVDGCVKPRDLRQSMVVEVLCQCLSSGQHAAARIFHALAAGSSSISSSLRGVDKPRFDSSPAGDVSTDRPTKQIRSPTHSAHTSLLEAPADVCQSVLQRAWCLRFRPAPFGIRELDQAAAKPMRTATELLMVAWALGGTHTQAFFIEAIDS
jgi:hypothetical protein